MIKIISDSTAYIPKEYANEHDITIIPLRVLYKEDEFEEGFPGSFEEFYEDFTKTKIFPKTSQPSLAAFVEEYNKAIEQNQEVLVFTIASSLSGTYNCANLAKDQCIDPTKIYVIDCQSTAQTNFGYIMEAVSMRKEGKSAQEIVEKIEALRESSAISFIPDTLEYLVKGGRIGKVSAKIGSLLQIKPIITFKKNVLSSKKSFGIQKAIKDMLTAIPEKIKRLFVLHIASTKFFEMLKNAVAQWLDKKPNKNEIEIVEGEVGPVVACHVGPAVGIAWTTI